MPRGTQGCNFHLLTSPVLRRATDFCPAGQPLLPGFFFHHFSPCGFRSSHFSLPFKLPSPKCSHHSSPFWAHGQSNFILYHWTSLHLLLRKLCHFVCVAATKFLESVSEMWIEIYPVSSPQQLLVSMLHIHAIELVILRSYTVWFLYSDQWSVCSRFSSGWKLLLVPFLGVSWCLLCHHPLMSQSHPDIQTLQLLRLPLFQSLLCLLFVYSFSSLCLFEHSVGGLLCCGRKAWVTLWSPGVCWREPCAPGRSNHAGSACTVRVQTKAALAGEHINPLTEGEPWQKTTGPPGYGGWALGQSPAPGKSRRLPL